MSYFLLQALHVTAALGLFTALGAICLAPSGGKGASILHGISLLLLLIAGLAILMTQGLFGSGGWWHTKILLWVALGVAPVLAKRKILPAPALLTICLALGALSAWLGLAKPF